MSFSVWGGKPPLVMIVDDQQSNIRLLGSVLDEAEFDVMPADSGERALTRMQAVKPDVVLLDMRMPNMDGFEVLQKLRSNPEWVDIPVVFLTAAHEREFLVKAFEGGAVDYITKPFVAEELVARVRTHAELKRSRDQLRTAIKEREDLATIVAHDLKNPLFNISLNAQLLLGACEADSRLQKRVKSIEASAKQAMAIVEHYLERRASVELREGYQPQITPVRTLLAEAAEEFADDAARAKQVVEVLDTDAAVQVACDLESTRGILRNLLSNALKYSPEGSRIELSGASTAAGKARLCVADRGPGIPEEEKAQLFRRYVRLQAKARDGATSSGVGLALARQEAERMGGELWHEPRAGGGSVFVLQLPVADAESSPTAA